MINLLLNNIQILFLVVFFAMHLNCFQYFNGYEMSADYEEFLYNFTA